MRANDYALLRKPSSLMEPADDLNTAVGRQPVIRLRWGGKIAMTQPLCVVGGTVLAVGIRPGTRRSRVLYRRTRFATEVRSAALAVVRG
jgi:hypothetical protein